MQRSCRLPRPAMTAGPPGKGGRRAICAARRECLPPTRDARYGGLRGGGFAAAGGPNRSFSRAISRFDACRCRAQRRIRQVADG